MEQEKEFMREAIRIAHQNIKEKNGGPFGVVIVKDGKIIATGSNHVTTSNDPTAHAEIVAIRNACKKLNSYQLQDCEIYSTCEPCPMCLGAIYWARPKKIYYANTKQDAATINFDDSFIYKEIEKPLPQRKIPMQQLLREEAIEIFKEWNQMEDKIEY